MYREGNGFERQDVSFQVSVLVNNKIRHVFTETEKAIVELNKAGGELKSLALGEVAADMGFSFRDLGRALIKSGGDIQNLSLIYKSYRQQAGITEKTIELCKTYETPHHSLHPYPHRLCSCLYF